MGTRGRTLPPNWRWLVFASIAFVPAVTQPSRAQDRLGGDVGAPPALAVSPSATVPDHPIRIRADFGMGYFNPKEVNRWLNDQIPSNSAVEQGANDHSLLFSFGLSGAYYPARFWGVRSSLVYLSSPASRILLTDGLRHSTKIDSAGLGVSLDFAYDQGRLVRYFVSPGLAYHVGWFDDYTGRGLGLSLAIGLELSFGEARRNGMYLAMTMRKAALGVTDRPSDPSLRVPAIHSLDFSSLLLCLGFHTGG